MVSKEVLKKSLYEGKDLSDKDYVNHCRKDNPKTFYYFCRKLSSCALDTSVSSTELNEYIIDELRHRGIVVKPHFNPQGWFGQAWTDWNDPSKNERYFRDEYRKVLKRTGENPYSYQIRSDYLETVRQIFDEFDRSDIAGVAEACPSISC